MGMYGSRAVTLLVLISDDVINRILKLDIQTNILVYVTRCCTDLTSKVLKERTFGQSSALLFVRLYKSLVRPKLEYCIQAWNPSLIKDIELLKQVQHRATKLIPEIAHLHSKYLED